MSDSTKYISRIQNNTTYDLRDRRIPKAALENANVGDVLTVALDSNSNKIMTPTAPAAQGLVLGNDVITQAGVDVTSGVKSALDLDEKADLVNGKVPASELPSFVDSVVEGYYYNSQFYEDSSHTQVITPETGKIYVDLPSNKTYRWGGTVYVEISSSLVLGETESTAYRGDRGKEAWQHSLVGKDSALTYSAVADYDSTKNYVVGDVVKNGTKIYRCLSNTTGTFNIGAWTQSNPHNLTHRDLNVVTSVNSTSPDSVTGNVTIEKVPFADNLYSTDNTEDSASFIFRTTGGSASLSTGEANLGSIQGNTIVTELSTPDVHQKSLISIAKPTSFQSTGLNAFNYNDSTSVLRGYTVTNGVITNGTSNDVIAICHAVGGVIAGNGFTGYTAAWLESDNTSITNVEHVLQTAWFVEGNTKPTAGTSGLTQLKNTSNGGLEWVDDDYGYRANLTFGDSNGYLVLVTNASYNSTSFEDRNISKLCIHPRWSGYMDGTYESYSVSTITIPTTYISGSLPTATYGFPSLTLNGTGEILRDTFNFQDLTYTQYIGRYENDGHGANIAIVAAITDEYIYDDDNILYQLPTPSVWSLESTVSGTYTANDFGTEEFLYSNTTYIPLQATLWYGQNLRDKLRTDVVTISTQTLTTSQQNQIKSNIGAVSVDDIGVAGGVASLDSDGKVPESELPKFVKSVNTESPDATGNVTITEVPLAENLLSPDNTSDIDTYIFRTAGGSASISDGEGALTSIKGYTTNPTKAEENFTITCVDVNEGTPFQVSINSNTWMQNTVVGWTSGTYTFEYDLANTRWTVSSSEAGLAGSVISLSGCGITITSGTVADKDQIIVNYTRVNNATGGVESSRSLSATVDASTFWTHAISVGFNKPNIDNILFTYVSSSDKWTATQEQLLYSSTSTYEVGDVVKYVTSEATTYSTYTCISAITTPEIWDITHWALKSANTSKITATGQNLSDYGITLAGTPYVEDEIQVSSSYDSTTSTATASISVTPHCYVEFEVTSAMLTTWFSSTSSVRNMIGPQGTAGRFEFKWNATDTVWEVTIGGTTTQYTKTALQSTFGISYTIESTSPTETPQGGDIIWVRPSILSQPRSTTVDYVGPNSFSASFGTIQSVISTNKALWRAALDTYGTNIYRFTKNFSNDLWTLAIMNSTGQTVSQIITTSAVLDNYGLILDGTAGRKDYISVNYIKEVLGTYLHTQPTSFKSVGTQQWNPSDFIANYRINSAGTALEAATGYYVAYVHACYANEQGWTIYSSNSKIDSDGTTSGTRISWCATKPVVGSTLVPQTVREDLGGNTYNESGVYTTSSLTSLANFYFSEETATSSGGYIVISCTGTPVNYLTVHPRWSGYKNLTSGYSSDTVYASHTTTITLPTTGINTSTQQTQSLPIADYGMPAVNSVADEMQLDRLRYVKNIERVTNTTENMEQVIALGTDYIYDTSYIYYVLSTPVIYTISVDNSYIVCDFGTEEFIGTTIPVVSTSLYGQNLRDKLRTDVLTISEQTLTSSQISQVKTNLDINQTSSFYISTTSWSLSHRIIYEDSAAGEDDLFYPPIALTSLYCYYNSGTSGSITTVSVDNTATEEYTVELTYDSTLGLFKDSDEKYLPYTSANNRFYDLYNSGTTSSRWSLTDSTVLTLVIKPYYKYTYQNNNILNSSNGILGIPAPWESGTADLDTYLNTQKEISDCNISIVYQNTGVLAIGALDKKPTHGLKLQLTLY